ncbi:MAG: co-chaperone DjlA [Steroidobacteraceae bacterium]
MSLTFLFGLIGLLVGGLRGLIWGAVIGYAAGRLLGYFLTKGVSVVQSQFLETTFAVMGAVCKADGVVTRDEIRATENLFERLHLGPEQRAVAMAAFARGKAPDFDLDAEVTRFARASRHQRPLLLMFLQMQVAAIAADGNVHAAEHQMLVRVARLLGLGEAEVAQLEALLRTGTAAPSPGRKLDDAYAALGLTPEATDAQIKQAYRRLMSQNHPDKLAAKGLPESMREMAEEKTREISTAYAVVKEARGFN